MFYDHRHPEPLERVIITLGYFSRKFKPSLQSYVPATESFHTWTNRCETAMHLTLHSHLN